MTAPRKLRDSRLSLYPLKPEAALAAFMKVDPAKVEAGMRKVAHKGGRKPALPKA
jgi:hypothetical protein